MQKFSLKFPLVASTTALLSACGGGGESGVLSASSQNFIGVNATISVDPQVLALVETAASTENGLSADFAGYIFESDSGFENGTAVENGNSIGLLTEIDLPTQTELRLFDGAYDDGSEVIAIYYGLAGPAPTEGLPNSGSASWSGSSFAQLISSSSTQDLGIGTATVTANFPGNLSASLTDLNGDMDVDEITLENLEIVGDRFTGSTVETLQSGSLVNVVGSSAIGAISGIFSGSQTAAGIPDEVGGLFSLTGDDATLIGGFVAD